ncbi:MAG: hypothetical protein FWD16_02640 [Clostridia bacterium]|nr:hypothetical protein [Clostridia bacterium]
MRVKLFCILLAVFCVLALAACSSDSIIPTEPPSITATATQAPETPTPTPAALAVGTRKNPAINSEALIYDGMAALYDNYRLELTVEKVIRGEEAETMVMAGNQFNEPSGEGREYVLVLINVKVLESKDEERVSLSSIDFDFYSAAGVRYDDYVVVTGLEHRFPDVYPADSGQPPAEIKGYAYQIVAADDTPVMVFKDNSDNRLWFGLAGE